MRLFLLFILFSVSSNLIAQFNNGSELFFYNTSSQNVIVRIYPVSGVFNNDHEDYQQNYFGNYNLVMTNRGEGIVPQKDFLNGTSVPGGTHRRYWNIPPGYPTNQSAKISFGFDVIGGSDMGTAGTIGFGIWMVEFFWGCTDPEAIYEPPYCLPDDYFTIEYDFGYVNLNRAICGDYADIDIRITDDEIPVLEEFNIVGGLVNASITLLTRISPPIGNYMKGSEVVKDRHGLKI